MDLIVSIDKNVVKVDIEHVRKRWRSFLVGILITCGVGLWTTPKTVWAVTFTRKVFLQNVTTSSIELRWVTDTHEQLVVKYGTSASYGSQVNSNTVAGTGGNNNHATITGLTPNTKYFYQVTSSGGTALTPVGDANYYFKTAPTTGSTTPFTWAIWGDSGSAGSANVSNLSSRKPDITFVAGDIGYPYSSDFNNNNTQYFNVYGGNVMRFSPFYVTCGNHETSCPTVMADHSLPGGGNMGGQISSYSFDYGNVRFVALNSNGSFAYIATNPQSSDPQMRWAYNDLRASGQPWKVVYWHHNGWSAGSHSTNTAVVNNLIRMSSDAGADLVIWGHSHVFERWFKKTGFYPNVQAYTIGNGGQASSSSCTSTSPGPGCAAHTGSNEKGFLFAQVNGDQMTISYVGASGGTDTITLNSGGTGPTNTPGPSPTLTRTPTPRPTSTQTPSPTRTRTPTPSRTPTPGGPTATRTPTPGACTSTLTAQGDANCDCTVSGVDYAIWLSHYRQQTGNGFRDGDFNGDGTVTGVDYAIWLANYRRTCTGPTPTPPSGATNTPTPTPGGATPPPQTGELPISICDRANGPFSTNITNPYFPMPVGMVHVLEGGGVRLQISVLNQTKVVGGVTTRVLEEREWLGSSLVEVSNNWFVQAPNGTVCYYGEDVFDGSGNPLPSGGAWIAYDDPQHPEYRPGIIMPANPAVGQTYYQEYAPGVALDRGEHVLFENSFTTPAGTFQNVLFVRETPPSTKRYAPGIGLIFDDGVRLTQR